ncbi:MAG: Trm112 family protein [Kofleriaceae bacterium]
MLPVDLVAVLACPKSKQPVIYFPKGEENRDESSAFLFCPASKLRYRVERGVPVMLVEEATEVPEATATALVARAKALGL